jgi:hypothetical protein
VSLNSVSTDDPDTQNPTHQLRSYLDEPPRKRPQKSAEQLDIEAVVKILRELRNYVPEWCADELWDICGRLEREAHRGR